MSFRGRIRSEKITYVLSSLSTLSTNGSSVRSAENGNTSHIRKAVETADGNLNISRKDSALSPIENRAGYPSVRRIGPGRRRAFCLASLTVEAALEFPLFLLCIILVLHYSVVCRAGTEFSGKMAEAAEQMAMAAYTKVYDDSSHVIRAALSDSWAYSQVVPKAKDKGAVKNASFAFSSFLKDNDRISLVLTYQVRSPVSVIRIPHTIFVQKMTIRGWTGKDGTVSGDGSSSEDSSSAEANVYVTDSGRVYHTDPNCTHLKLTITQISKEQLKTVRNYKGARYKRCRRCGGKIKAGDTVFINPYGDAYHASASCPGLTRNVSTVPLKDVHGMHECSDCAKRRQHNNDG